MNIWLLVICAPILCYASSGAVHVQGRLLCSGAIYSNEKVQIWDPNFLIGYDLWSETTTDDSGYFSIKASGDDWSGVDPFVWIPNYCGSVMVGNERCSLGLIQINVPKEFVSHTHTPRNIFDIGTIQLVNFKHTDRMWISSVFGKSKECRDY